MLKHNICEHLNLSSFHIWSQSLDKILEFWKLSPGVFTCERLITDLGCSLMVFAYLSSVVKEFPFQHYINIEYQHH